jgi:hypothetical protein
MGRWWGEGYVCGRPLRREADIAIRHLKPEQPDLIARQIREAEAH